MNVLENKENFEKHFVITLFVNRLTRISISKLYPLILKDNLKTKPGGHPIQYVVEYKREFQIDHAAIFTLTERQFQLYEYGKKLNLTHITT